MSADFGSTKMARRSLQRAEREQDSELLAEREEDPELMAERQFIRQISIAKAARGTSARGISLAEQVKAPRLIPMLVVFGLTKISQRIPPQSAAVLAKNHQAEFPFTVPAAWVTAEKRKVPAETSQVAKAKIHDVAAVPETRAAPARVFGRRPAAEVDRKQVK